MKSTMIIFLLSIITASCHIQKQLITISHDTEANKFNYIFNKQNFSQFSKGILNALNILYVDEYFCNVWENQTVGNIIYKTLTAFRIYPMQTFPDYEKVFNIYKSLHNWFSTDTLNNCHEKNELAMIAKRINAFTYWPKFGYRFTRNYNDIKEAILNIIENLNDDESNLYESGKLIGELVKSYILD